MNELNNTEFSDAISRDAARHFSKKYVKLQYILIGILALMAMCAKFL